MAINCLRTCRSSNLQFRIVRVSSTLTHLANTFYFVLGPFLNILLVLGQSSALEMAFT